jgi:hypothetical protein
MIVSDSHAKSWIVTGNHWQLTGNQSNLWQSLAINRQVKQSLTIIDNHFCLYWKTLLNDCPWLLMIASDCRWLSMIVNDCFDYNQLFPPWVCVSCILIRSYRSFITGLEQLLREIYRCSFSISMWQDQYERSDRPNGLHHPKRRVFQWTMRRLSDGKDYRYPHSQQCYRFGWRMFMDSVEESQQ